MRTKFKKSLSILLISVLFVGLLSTVAYATSGSRSTSPELITNITATVVAPTAGESAIQHPTPSTPADAYYYAAEFGNYWFITPTAGDTWVYDSYSPETVFEDNKWYKLSSTIYAEPGYYFDESTTINIAGAEQTKIFRLDGAAPYYTTARFYAWFKVGNPTDALSIESITISNLPETSTAQKYNDWNNEIITLLASQTENMPGIAYVYSDLYSMSHTATDYGYEFQGSRWKRVTGSAGISADANHGVLLTFARDGSGSFSDTLTVNINGRAADIIYRDDEILQAFLPLSTDAVIKKIHIQPSLTLVDGNRIPDFDTAFELATYYNSSLNYGISRTRYINNLCPYTITEGLIKDLNYTDLDSSHTNFGTDNYWLIATLEAKPGTRFASEEEMEFSFSGTTGSKRITVSDDGKTCTIARMVGIYDFVCIDPSDSESSALIGFPQPEPGKSYNLGRVYGYSGLAMYTECHETPFIGSTESIKRLSYDNANPENTDIFEAGKIYLAKLKIEARGDWRRFGEEFVPQFVKYDDPAVNTLSKDDTPLQYNLMKVAKSTATEQKFYLWFSCGNPPAVSTIRNTNINITGPTLPTEDDETFALTEQNCSIDNEARVKFDDIRSTQTNGELYLHFMLKPESGYAFGRNINVSYNNTPLEIYIGDTPAFSRQAYINYMPGGYKIKFSNELDVQGRVDREYSGTETLHLALNGTNEFRDVNVDDDVTGWITNIPQGMTAKISELVYSDEWEDEIIAVKISFAGTPTEAKNEPICVTLPAAKQYRSAVNLTASENENVKFSITATTHQGSHEYSTEWRSVAENGHAHFCTITGCTSYDQDSLEAHIPGSAATEDAAQLCTVCGYEISPKTTHAPMLVEGYAATTDAPGRKDYYYCENCGKYYEDVTSIHEITGDIDEWCHIPMIIAIVEGDNSEWTQGDSTGLMFKSNAEYDNFTNVKVDNNELERDADYTVVAGSTIVTLHPTYLETLSVGEHTIVIESVDEAPEAKFTVRAAGGGSGGGSGGRSTPITYSISVEKAENGSVTTSSKLASRGKAVTVTVAPDTGYYLDTLTVLGQTGNEIELTDKDGKYSFVMPASKVTVKATFSKSVATIPFTDIKDGDYFYDAVLWAVENGITNGISETTFNPDESCTRAQIVTFLWRAAGSPDAKNAVSFSDVATDSYYAEAVAWAVEQGITVGTGDATFSPDATCTRAQAVTFLSRTIKGTGVADNTFSDVAAHSYYAEAVAWAVANGITHGTSATTFSPDADCTRGQIVTFLFRAMAE